MFYECVILHYNTYSGKDIRAKQFVLTHNNQCYTWLKDLKSPASRGFSTDPLNARYCADILRVVGISNATDG